MLSARMSKAASGHGIREPIGLSPQPKQAGNSRETNTNRLRRFVNEKTWTN